MREIKFRAWIARDPYEETPVMEMCYDLAFEEYEPINDLLANQDNLMQYTGLKDKNGVEIYEGDILSGEFGKDTVELEEYHIDGGGTAICYVYSYSPLNQGLVEEVGIEVIGNIYENPELLKD